jgi:predicted GIY-YIG superfamily endonuclease
VYSRKFAAKNALSSCHLDRRRFFERRIYQHKYDTIEGFTQKYQCHRLVYYESYQDVQVAIAREKQMKR